MLNQIVLWNSPNGAELPANVSNIVDLTSYVNMLSEKEVAKIRTAFTSELYDMAVEYTWNRTINILREKVLSFGREFVLEMLGRNAEGINDQEDFLSEVDIINLSADLGLINKTAKMLFINSSELIRHYLSRDTEDELDITQANATIKACVKYVLAMTDDDHQISFTNFRDILKREILNEQDELYRTLQTSPYFYKRTTVRTLLNLSKTQKGGELEIVFANMVNIIPTIWGDLLSDDRYPVGYAYAEATNEGNSPLVKALKSVLLKTKGFDYVPESLRSNTFIEAANHLLSRHFGTNNFYNEPAAAKNLQSLGSSIPVPALGKCMTATLACKLGNIYGVSWNAQEHVDKILNTLTADRWEYYLNSVLPVDEVVIFKLRQGGDILDRWIQLVKEYELNEKNIKEGLINKLIQSSAKGHKGTIKSTAEELYNRIR
ncbi:hypothetical protein BLGI_4702 [Brevibacillus laterosporus GI-9]|uniref:hypothetical protein n=1 Tax=Brevibacillus laterosporus TaxID=1465 RepID=UPI000240524F|nr:hypothetical protein [Brevibacillus laterosporus]CCF16733.1 hypothetical protein BLGI_4702 [Brevibacillus laterosporus GI-9]